MRASLTSEFSTFFKLENLKAYLDKVKEISQQSLTSLNDISSEISSSETIASLFNQYYTPNPTEHTENTVGSIRDSSNNLIRPLATAITNTGN